MSGQRSRPGEPWSPGGSGEAGRLRSALLRLYGEDAAFLAALAELVPDSSEPRDVLSLIRRYGLDRIGNRSAFAWIGDDTPGEIIRHALEASSHPGADAVSDWVSLARSGLRGAFPPAAAGYGGVVPELPRPELVLDWDPTFETRDTAEDRIAAQVRAGFDAIAAAAEAGGLGRPRDTRPEEAKHLRWLYWRLARRMTWEAIRTAAAEISGDPDGPPYGKSSVTEPVRRIADAAEIDLEGIVSD